jgi:hypothetical protein
VQSISLGAILCSVAMCGTQGPCASYGQARLRVGGMKAESQTQTQKMATPAANTHIYYKLSCNTADSHTSWLAHMAVSMTLAVGAAERGVPSLLSGGSVTKYSRTGVSGSATPGQPLSV